MRSSHVLLATAAILLFPVTEAAAGCTLSGFSGAASVCGTATVFGGSSGPMVQSPAPLLNQESGTAVAVGAAGAGDGIGGFVTATGSFGAAHIFASSFDSVSYPSNANAVGQIGFVDGFTVGSTNLNVQFVSSVSGTFLGFGTAGYVHFNLNTTNLSVLYDKQLFVYDGSPVQSATYDVTLLAGQTYLFDWSMEADAISAKTQYGYFPSALTDLSHTGTLHIDVLTPGGHLNFLSGHDYSSSPGVSAVPETSTWAMMILGFAGVGFMAYRRKPKPSYGELR
jgi:hypothetical protein